MNTGASVRTERTVIEGLWAKTSVQETGLVGGLDGNCNGERN